MIDTVKAPRQTIRKTDDYEELKANNDQAVAIIRAKDTVMAYIEGLKGRIVELEDTNRVLQRALQDELLREPHD